MKKEISSSEALARTAALCSRSEYCESDIIIKLKKWNLSENDIEQIMDRLIKEKYIDNNRFCEAYIKDKFRYNSWGKIKIAHYLKTKGFGSLYIKNKLNEIIDNTEYTACLKRLLISKRKSISDENKYKCKEKLVRFAVSRGFELDEILKFVDDII